MERKINEELTLHVDGLLGGENYFSVVHDEEANSAHTEFALLFHSNGVGGWGEILIAFGTAEGIKEVAKKIATSHTLAGFGYARRVAGQIVGDEFSGWPWCHWEPEGRHKSRRSP